MHKIPVDFKEALASRIQALKTWEDITPLARNEWVCWIESAKRNETRVRRMSRACVDLKKGKRRPCCWAGCQHK